MIVRKGGDGRTLWALHSCCAVKILCVYVGNTGAAASTQTVLSSTTRGHTVLVVIQTYSCRGGRKLTIRRRLLFAFSMLAR